MFTLSLAGSEAKPAAAAVVHLEPQAAEGSTYLNPTYLNPGADVSCGIITDALKSARPVAELRKVRGSAELLPSLNYIQIDVPKQSQHLTLYLSQPSSTGAGEFLMFPSPAALTNTDRR